MSKLQKRAIAAAKLAHKGIYLEPHDCWLLNSDKHGCYEVFNRQGEHIGFVAGGEWADE